MAFRQQIILPRPQRRSAFTLIELLISVAIALVLVLGVNQVFKIAAQTVGTGQAFSGVTRDERVAHFSVYTDVHNALTTAQPALVISSQGIVAFNTQQDASNEPSGVPNTITINGVQQPVVYGLASSRYFRIDTLGFFASGDLYQRQTANDGTFVSPTTSSNAYIWYGHMALPNNQQAQTPATYSTSAPPVLPPTTGNPPATTTTPTGQWFGPGWPDASTTLRNDNNRYASEWILGRVAMLFVPTPPTGDYYLQAGTGNPLGSSAMATDGSTPIYSSRYDEVGSSIAQFNNAATNFPGSYTPPATAQLAFRSSMFFRYQANPFPIKPLTAANMAAAAPIFLRHCSQFIVEYAGDYVTQASNGAITAATGDNVVDFVVDPVTGAHKIRWYGFPRDTNNDGSIDIQHDVVPLRDVLQTVQAGATAPWENFNDLAPAANYAASNAVKADSQYTCSWGTESQWTVGTTSTSNGLPRMLRITLALDDPAGRMASPQIYEYVIDLGSQQ
jgi:prepilin-type N-terminal cleavage/methylation domain-containing protein